MYKIYALRFFLLVLLCLILSSCLTTEYKKYYFKINADGSGEGWIEFVNIISEEDEEKNVSFKDFGELISDYAEGTQFEQDNPNYQVYEKELYEKNGALNGLIKFRFDNYRKIGFYRYDECECSPFMYYIGTLSETLVETNGKDLTSEYSFMPMIIWPAGSSEFTFTTKVQEDLTNTHSLLDHYRVWNENN